MAHGLPAAEARRLALVSIGGMEQARYRHREARGFMNIDILMQDLKYTIRTLWRDPSFTVVAVLILALAIGANIAVFSVVNTLLLRPLPFQNAQQLVWIAPPPTKCGLSCATYSTDAYDRISRNEPFLPGCDGVLCVFEFGQSEPEPGWRSADNGNQHRRHREFLPGAGSAGADGPRIHARRCPQWSGPGGAADPCVVEAAVQWRPANCGQGVRHERPADYGNRRTACVIRFWRGVLRRERRSMQLRHSISMGRRATGATSSRSSGG